MPYTTNGAKRESVTAQSTGREVFQQFYDSDTFSDVTILMIGQQPMPSKRARKSVAPLRTFHAHKIVLSAGSRVFAEYFRTHPKDENTDNVCKLDLSDLYGEMYHEPEASINVAMLRHLYGQSLFAPSEDGENEPVVDVQTWHHLCIVAHELGMPDLTKQACEELEAHFEEHMQFDEQTGLLRDKASIAWFVGSVEQIYDEYSTEHPTDVVDMVSKFACRHFTELEESESFRTLISSAPDIGWDMLRYGARQKSQFLR